MFDKDKEIGADILEEFGLRSPFILWDARMADELVETRLGKARKSILVCSQLAAQGEADRQEYTTLASAIADKVEQKSDGDLPAIVELRKVESRANPGQDALVLQFVRPLSSDPFEGLDATGEEPAERATTGRRK